MAEEPDLHLRARLQDGPEILFGSLSGGPGWIEWSDSMSISRDNLQLAAGIYLFDTIIQNWDRCVPNPNMLVKGDRFLMIDHGEAFVSATGTDAERDYHQVPWVLGGVQNHEGEFEAHPLWSKLRHRKLADFAAAADRWKDLPSDTFDLIAADVPPCWDRSAAARIVSYLNEAVQNIDAILANVEQNLVR